MEDHWGKGVSIGIHGHKRGTEGGKGDGFDFLSPFQLATGPDKGIPENLGIDLNPVFGLNLRRIGDLLPLQRIQVTIEYTGPEGLGPNIDS
jgi:hypothetical protein